MKLSASILVTVALATMAGRVQAQPATDSKPAAAATAAVQKIATVDALLLVDLLLDAEPLQSERTARGKACQETFNAEQKKLMDLEAKLLMGAQDDPKRPEMIKEWEQEKKTLNDLQAQLTAHFDRYNSLKAGEAWKTLQPIIQRHAAAGGYTHVIAARQFPNFVADSQSSTVQQLLSRQAILFPAADDLTMRIVEELKLQTQLETKRANEAKAAADGEAFLKAPAPAPPQDSKDAPKIPMAPKESPRKSGLPDRLPGTTAPAENKQPK